MADWNDVTVSLKEHLEVIRAVEKELSEERDRRYSEVSIEKEKALKIKEVADLAALGLAREIQTYKDEKANQLREQINSERGVYATKSEMKPVLDYVASQQGSSKGADKTLSYLMMALIAVNVVVGMFLALR